MDTEQIKEGMHTILQGLDADLEDGNFRETPDRVARMYEEIFAGVKDTDVKVQAILDSSFPAEYDQIIAVRDIETFGMCPHHFLPVQYWISVAYIPGQSGEVLGLSKLVRLVELLAKRPVLQEQLTQDITESLMSLKQCVAAGCIIKGRHYCMIIRGVRQSQATTVTSSLHGAFFDKPEARQEFMDLVGGGM